MGCEEDVAKIGKKLENMVANGTTVSLLHKIINKQTTSFMMNCKLLLNMNLAQPCVVPAWGWTLDLVYYRLGWWLFTGIGVGAPSVDVFFFFFVIRHSFTIEDLVSAPNLKLGCAVILRGCASDYK